MMRIVRLITLFLIAASLFAADNLKLYLKDGGYHLVREYQVQGDRIRYFSAERDEWEEIPVTLVDLAKTEKERSSDAERLRNETRSDEEEEKAERAWKREIASIPMEPGAYYKRDDKMLALPSDEYQVITDKKRRVIQVLSPVPLIPGKASVVIKGEHSGFVLNEDRPSFYFRLAKEERFGIVSLTTKKNARVVENISIIPVAKQAYEDRKQTETFEQELGDGLFRIWPEKPLAPGEYALIEFSDTEDANQDIQLMIWDFAYHPAGSH